MDDYLNISLISIQFYLLLYVFLLIEMLIISDIM